MKNQKIILASLFAAFTLAACSKPSDDAKTAQNDAQPAATAQADTATEDTAKAEDKADEHGEHDAHDGHDHESENHEGHDHEGHDHGDHAGHDHAHAGNAYQCGDKTVYLAIHDHEGEMEAHLTTDDIEYDLNQDPANANRYTTDDGITGGSMAMTVAGDKIKVTGADNAVLLDCSRKS